MHELTATAEGFSWQPASWGEVLTCDALATVAPHAFTTKALDVRAHNATPPDTWAHVGKHLGVDRDHVLRLQQIHGTSVVLVRRGDALPVEPPPGDIAISDRSDVALVVQAADCVPVLLADIQGRAMGIVHAGWRGTLANAVGRAVASLQDTLGVEPSDVIAAIGPSIGRCCYEVGAEVQEAFGKQSYSREALARWFDCDDRGRLTLDLWRANADQLLAAGLAPARIHVARLCTASHVAWFPSYRVEGGRARRLVGCIRLRP